MRFIFCLFYFALIGNISASMPSLDVEGPSPIILILDGSGSMWGKLGSETKIVIARRVVGQVLGNIEADRPIGLVAYGHRQKGDCEDIEFLHEAATGNRDAINASLAKINPVGKTPLANTALQVIEKLKATRESATIILVSDGAESCGGDLCEVIRAAKEAGLDFVLHIVGFDIGESDKGALQCAAQAGEGLYLDAADADGLTAALEQASEITVEEKMVTLGVKVTKDRKLHDTAVKIYRPGESKYFTSMRTYSGEKTNPAMFPLPAGTYDIQAQPLGVNVNGIWRRGVVVPAEGEVPLVEIDFTPGKLSIRTTNNEAPWDCTVNIYPAGQTKGRSAGGRTYTGPKSNPMIKTIDPGLYDVYVKALGIGKHGVEHIFKNVAVKVGETTEIGHNFLSGKVLIGATHNGELWDCTVNVSNAEGYVHGSRTYTSASSNPREFLLAPGTYEVVVNPLKLDAPKQTISITIVQEETVEKILKF